MTVKPIYVPLPEAERVRLGLSAGTYHLRPSDGVIVDRQGYPVKIDDNGDDNKA